MDPIELLAVQLGLICVLLTIQQHVACWPTGLAMVILYIYIFFQAKLYSDMLLQVVYVALQIYGWYAWCRGGRQHTPLTVSHLSARSGLAWSVVGLLGATALGRTMQQMTDASFPYTDALATTASLIAQWLMGRKIVESWVVWIAVDLISIPMYLAKELYVTALLYVVFLGLAIWGWFEWSRAWRSMATA